jgi:23S rRNA pseudouridine2605 synthase
MTERIQKILSARGVCSRREAERLMAAGRVTVNGQPASVGDQADPDTDVIAVDGEALPDAPRLRYIMLHKPRGYVTTCEDEHGRRTVMELVADCGARVYPVGRLDMDSEGLLLLTNDGAFANRLMHPSHEIGKTYFVRVSGFCMESLDLLRRPIVLDGYAIRPPEVELLAEHGTSADLRIVIHEGRNRQIRRMCEQAGVQVLTLRRIQEGNVKLGNLPLGQWRDLTEAEISALQR